MTTSAGAPATETLVDTPRLRIIRVPDVGPEGNNVYVVSDPRSGEAAFIDAPAEPEVAIAAAGDLRPSKILITHTHSDHTAGLTELKAAFGAKVYCHPLEPYLAHELVDVALVHEGTVEIGGTSWRVIHTPGHTPGSTCLFHHDVAATVLFSGDTLFPGGPGWSATPLHLRREIESIKDRLLTLPPETAVFPGHGPGTTIRTARAEYRYFASRPHPDDLHGDVLWIPAKGAADVEPAEGEA